MGRKDPGGGVEGLLVLDCITPELSSRDSSPNRCTEILRNGGEVLKFVRLGGDRILVSSEFRRDATNLRMGAVEELVLRLLEEETFLEAGEAAGEEENIRLADAGDGEVDEDAVEEDVLLGLVEVGLHMEA